MVAIDAPDSAVQVVLDDGPADDHVEGAHPGGFWVEISIANPPELGMRVGSAFLSAGHVGEQPSTS